jgi:uncharacterized protein (TIGR02996 family)
MPPPGYEPFLRAICASPEDDTVRLVYADWLAENGDEDRAEFIRLQVAISNSSEMAGEQVTRADELRKKNEKLWKSELPRLPGIEWASYFWRGFVSGVTVDTGKWLIQQREQIFQTAPIQSLVLNDAGLATLQRVLEVPEIEHLTTLTLQHCRIREGEWKALTDCPRLTRLKALRFAAVFLGYSRWVAIFSDEDARAFVETPHLPRLESLHIDGTVSPAALALLRTRYKSVKAL